MVRYTELSRPVQKFRALTANPRARGAAAESRDLVLVPYTGVPGPTVMIQRKEIVASLLPAPR